MEYSPFQTTLRDLLFVLFKRKWSMLIIVAVSVISAVGYLWLVREQAFTTSAKVLVKLGREQAAPDTLVGGQPQVVGYRYQEANSEAIILQSSELLNRVIDELHLDKIDPIPPRPTETFARLQYDLTMDWHHFNDWMNDKLIELHVRERLTQREKIRYGLQQALVVRGDKDSNIFTAELTWPRRHEATVILNRLLDDYLDFRIHLYQSNGLGFFETRASKTAGDLQKSDDAIHQYESAGDISVLEKQQEGLVQQIGTAAMIVRESERIRDEAASKVKRLDTELAKEDPNFGSLGEFDKDSFPATVLRQMADLQKEREKLRMTELETSDRVQNNRSQFKVLTTMLAANLRSTEAEKETDFQTRKANLQTLQTQLAALHDRQTGWEELKRKGKANEDEYTFYRQKLEQAATDQALDRQRIGSVSIVDPAIDPVMPAGTRRTTLLFLCIVVSILASLAWASVAEFFDHGVYSEDALEKLVGVPVIVVSRARKRTLLLPSSSANPPMNLASAHAGE